MLVVCRVAPCSGLLLQSDGMYEDLDASLINYNKAIILLQARSCMPPIQAATCAPEVAVSCRAAGLGGTFGTVAYTRGCCVLRRVHAQPLPYARKGAQGRPPARAFMLARERQLQGCEAGRGRLE